MSLTYMFQQEWAQVPLPEFVLQVRPK